MKLTKGQLVDMDNRFLNWLITTDNDGGGNYEDYIDKHSFLVVLETRNEEVDFRFFEFKDELIQYLKETYQDLEDDDNSLMVEAVFDLITKKELKFKHEIKITLTEIQNKKT